MRLMSVLFVATLALSVSACSKDPEVLKQEYAASGDRYFSEKKYAEAIVQYRNAVAQDARFGEARFKLAKAAEATGDVITALREYVRAADLLPEDMAVQLRAGQVLLAARQYPEARTRADNVLKKEPKNVQALVLMGNAMAGMKDLSGAITELEEAVEADPRRVVSYANLGAVQLASGNQKAAEGAFKRAVELEPNSTSAHLSLANYYWAAKDLAAAEKEFKSAETLEPNSPVVLRAVSAFYLLNNRLEDAERALIAYSGSTKEVAPALMLADLYLGTNRVPQAVATLEPLTKDENGFAAATIRLAALDFNAKNEQGAFQKLDAVIAKEPANQQAMLLKARILLTGNRAPEALALAEKVVDANPKFTQGLYYKGLALAATGNRARAIEVFNELLAQAPGSFLAQTKLAELQVAAGNYAAATELAQQAIKQQPQSGPAHMVLAQAALAQGNVTRAALELDLLQKTNADSADVQLLSGRLNLRSGNLAAARLDFKRVIELQPTSIEAVVGLVRVELADRKPEAARTLIGDLMAKHPGDPELTLLAGATYRAVGDHQQAETAYKAALEKNPQSFEAYRSLGNFYMQQNRLDDAKKQFEEAAAKRPEVAAGARTMLGTILDIQNKRDDARKEYEKALALDNRAAIAANNLAWSYADEGTNLDVALQLAQTAKVQLPDSAEVNDTLGWIYYKKGLSTLAVTSLKESVSKDALNPLTHYHLGLAYMKSGNRAEARKSLTEALRLAPAFPAADDAKRVLATLKG